MAGGRPPRACVYRSRGIGCRGGSRPLQLVSDAPPPPRGGQALARPKPAAQGPMGPRAGVPPLPSGQGVWARGIPGARPEGRRPAQAQRREGLGQRQSWLRVQGPAAEEGTSRDFMSEDRWPELLTLRVAGFEPGTMGAGVMCSFLWTDRSLSEVEGHPSSIEWPRGMCPLRTTRERTTGDDAKPRVRTHDPWLGLRAVSGAFGPSARSAGPVETPAG